MGHPVIEYRAEAWDILQYLFKTQKINDHTLHFVATFSDKIDFSRLKKSLNLSLEVFPLLKCRFKESTRRPCWEKCEYTVDDVLTLIESENEEKALYKFLYSEVDASTGPQIKAGVLRGAKNDTLVVLVNHMLCDAAGFKDYLYILSNIYNDINNPDFHLPILGSRRLYQITKSFSFNEKVKIIKSKNDLSTHDPAKFHLDGDLNNPFIETRNILAETFSILKVYTKNHGATVNDVILTAYIRTLYQRFGHVIAVPSTVDLRKYLKTRQAEGICNLCTNLTCNIGFTLGTTFEETLQKVKQCMDNEKSSISCMKSISLLEKVFDLLPYKLAKVIVEKSFINAPIAFTNIGIIDNMRFCFEGLKVTNAYMTGSIKYSPYFQLAISTFGNKPTLSVNLFGTQKDRNNISAFLDDLIKELYDGIDI